MIKTRARRVRRKNRKSRRQRGGFLRLRKLFGSEKTNKEVLAMLDANDNKDFPEINEKIKDLYFFVKSYYDQIYHLDTSNKKHQIMHDKIMKHNGDTTKQLFEELIELRDALRDLVNGSTTLIIPGSKISTDMKAIRKDIEAATQAIPNQT